MTIIGAGGGGGVKGGGTTKPRRPSEAKDSLNSTAYAKVIDLLCEGEIEGFPSARAYARDSANYNTALLKDVYFNNTPVLNPKADPTSPDDSDFNFQDVTVIPRYGTQTQSVIPGFDEILQEIQVGVTIENGLPATRTIVDPNVDSMRIVLTIPQLQKLKDNGDIDGSNVAIAIDVQYNGGGFTTVVEDTFKGRTTDQYQRDYRITLTNTAKPVDIRIRRLTSNSTTAKEVNAVIWTSYSEIVQARLNYPNSALVALRVDAEQFSSIPSRSYRIRGRKVQIPSNGTVDPTNGRITYSGIWNGTFAAAQWTTDPAWCLWDLLVNSRFGCGNFLNASTLDRWAFYAASQYCAELVPNGFGGSEPRFSINAVIQTEGEAFDVINQLCSVFRAMAYWSSGSMTISQDRPTTPSYAFNATNVVDGFNYTGSDLKTRPTLVSVKYFDMEARAEAYELVEDPAGIAAYGIVKTEISAFGCTSRGQAQRVGEWLLYTSHKEGEVNNFTASIEAGVSIRPGAIVRVSDPTRAGQRMGGRIVSATTTSITVDGDVPAFAPGARIMAMLPNGTLGTKFVTSIVGNTINCNAFGVAPAANSVWVYEQPSLLTSLWRVLAIREVEQCQYEITAIAHDPSKYAFVERGVPLQPRDVTNLNEPPASPTNLRTSEVLYDAIGRAATKIVVSWRAVIGIQQYRVRWRNSDGNWTNATVNRLDYEILDATPGEYLIQVAAVSASFVLSPAASVTINVQGKTAKPANISGLSVIAIDGKSATLSWNPVSDLDVRIGGRIIIRHTPLTTGAYWGAGQEIVASASGSQTQKVVPLLNGTYMVKAEDDSGNRSVSPAFAVIDKPVIADFITIADFSESTEIVPFPGTKTNMQYDSTLQGLVLSGGTLIDSVADFDALTSVDEPIQYAGSGEYICQRLVQLDGVYEVDIERVLDSAGIAIGVNWDSRTELIDTWSNIDGSDSERVGCIAYVRSSRNLPTDPTIVWSEWSEFSSATVVGCQFQFKAMAYSDATDESIKINSFVVRAFLRRRIETFSAAQAGQALTFANPFSQPPIASVTPLSAIPATYVPVITATNSTLNVIFAEPGNESVTASASYNVIVTGYGRRIS